MFDPDIIGQSTEDSYDREMRDGAMRSVGPGFWEEVLQDVYRGRDAAAMHRMAQFRQRRVKQQSDMLKSRINDTMGVPKYTVDAKTYHAWAWFFRDANDTPDYSCWDDAEFIRELLRDNEECRVEVEKKGNRVGYSGSLNGRAGVRHQSHGNGSPARPVNKVTLTDNRGNLQ